MTTTLKALDFKAVKEKTSLSRSHVWKLEQAGQFPKRFNIGARGVRWIESEIDEWLSNRAQAGDSRADKTA
ncbi:MAG: AlpA family phage regulatory protein [Thiofilum sp.]|uniref:helix-turn-helix transcriptional regulator n=1 Tax=Thiofilum sp. TaxID=2212733 RepID=UPI0025FDE48D|nr:AlpA family phage regulatory protein [Thiofilum sp.]MBK8451768.1 AlpA family phage regulatory protein [Thiofilum sp.]